MSLGDLWSERNQIAIDLKCRLSIATVFKCCGQVKERLPITGTKHDRGAKRFDCSQIVAHAKPRSAQHELSVETIRRQTHCSFCGRQRAGIVVCDGEHDCQQNERVGRALIRRSPMRV